MKKGTTLTKKYLSIFLAILMILSTIPMTMSFAAFEERTDDIGNTYWVDGNIYYGYCGKDNLEDITWTFDEDTGIIEFTGTGKMKGYPSASGITPWYYFDAKKAIISDGITSVGDSLFFSNISLEEVELSDSVTSIGKYAFAWCESLKSVKIPEYVTKIGMAAFYGCTELKEIVIPAEVKEIGLLALGSEWSFDASAPVASEDFAIIVAPGTPAADAVANYYKLMTEGAVMGGKTYRFADFSDKVEVKACEHTTTKTVKANVVEPTCTAEGSYDLVVKCADCGKELSRTTEAIEMIDHDLEEVIIEPTCDMPGNTMYVCKDCGFGFTTFLMIPPKGHDYVDSVVAPTCTSKGYTICTCKDCGDSYTTDEVAAKGHADTNGDGKCDSCGAELSQPHVARCSWCAKYEANKNSAFGFIFQIIHSIIHALTAK